MKERIHEPLAETLRGPGAILLVSCYEVGHQPLGLASPLGFLERVGFTPEALDIAVERFDREKATRARFVGISVPMHTLRLGVRVAEEVRRVNPRCHICFVQYTIRLLVPPGSALLARPTIRPFLGPLDQASFSYRWTHPDSSMDRLHESVCPMVEEATRAEEDPGVTFVRVRELAETMAGLARSESHRPEPLSERRRPPRLTEPWFC